MKRSMIAAAAVVIGLSATPALAGEMQCDEAGMAYLFTDLATEHQHQNNVITAYEEAVLAMKAMAAKDTASCLEHMHKAMTVRGKK